MHCNLTESGHIPELRNPHYPFTPNTVNYRMPQYHVREYWEERYTREPSAFDWYQPYAGLAPIIKKYLTTDSNVLQVGVGTSRLGSDMVQLGGFKSITNIDYSEVVIKHMSELHKGIPELKYQVADVRYQLHGVCLHAYMPYVPRQDSILASLHKLRMHDVQAQRELA